MSAIANNFDVEQYREMTSAAKKERERVCRDLMTFISELQNLPNEDYDKLQVLKSFIDGYSQDVASKIKNSKI